MLIIRLKRSGKKNKVFFHLVITEKEKSAVKAPLEVLASYNPHTKNFVLKSADRLNYWLDKKVAVSPTAHNLLVKQNLVTAPKVKAFKPKKKKEEKK